MDTAALLKELTEARGPSGYESEVRKIVQRRFGEFSDQVRTDSLGSLIARKSGEGDSARPGPRPSIMLAGHMDEIALMVTQIEKGFLRVTSIGGFDARVLLAQRVTVHGRRELPGLIVSVPPHFTDPAEREKPIPLEKLFVDVGLPPEEVQNLARVGDLVTLRSRFTQLSGGYAFCKSLDDRAGVASIAICLEELSGRKHLWDVYAVATVQEEVGLKGAMTSAYGIDPTAAIAVDVTFGQQPGLSNAESMKMDGGPCIAIGPNVHPKIFDRLVAAAKSLEISHQVEPIPGASGTDAWAIQVCRSGVPTGLLSIPIRSMHTSVETVSLRDIERTGKLMAELIARLDGAFAETLVTRDALAAGDAGGEATAIGAPGERT